MDEVLAKATLGVSPGATPEEVRAAYRRRAFETHPDRAAGSAAAFQAVAEAYRVLAGPGGRAQEGASASEGSSRVPGTDAAKVLFEYLSDLASEMILNGATPDAVVSFLASEGCPETVARALERDLRMRVQPAPNEAPAAASGQDAQPRSPEDGPTSGPGAAAPIEQAPAPQPRRGRFPLGWSAAAIAGAAAAACAVLAWRSAAGTPPSPARGDPAPVAVSSAPPPSGAAAPASAPGANAPGRAAATVARPASSGEKQPAATPPRGAPPRTRIAHAPPQRPPARDGGSLEAMGAAIDAEREALEGDRRRLAAEAAQLEAERRRIDAAEAALGPAADPAATAALQRQKVAYNARILAARRTEKALQRRTEELNARILAYNGRVRARR